MQATRNLVLKLAYSPDGRFLAAGTVQGEVAFWDTTTGNLVALSPAHSGAIWAICFTPDGRSLVSAGNDGTLKIHPVPPRSNVIK